MKPVVERRTRLSLLHLTVLGLSACHIAGDMNSGEPVTPFPAPANPIAAADTASSTTKASVPDSILDAPKGRYSQHKEELIIRHFFKDRRDGFFVDVGAFEWQRFSTTYYLEKHLGWQGIAIDALERLGKGYEDNRPGTKFFNYIVTDTSGGTATLHVAGGVSSTDPEWSQQFEGTRDKKINAVEVPKITLNDLLDQQKVTKVDFLSMDIEGGEVAALAGFDINRFAPDLVCIEAAKYHRKKLLAYFTKHEYVRIPEYDEYDQVNWYFRPKKGAS